MRTLGTPIRAIALAVIIAGFLGMSAAPTAARTVVPTVTIDYVFQDGNGNPLPGQCLTLYGEERDIDATVCDGDAGDESAAGDGIVEISFPFGDGIFTISSQLAGLPECADSDGDGTPTIDVDQELFDFSAPGVYTQTITFGECPAAPTGGDHATVTVHKATCPAGTADLFAACHDNGLGGVDFAIDGFEVGSQTLTTDANGVASGTILEAAASGDITLTEDPAVAAGYAGAYVYCSEQGSGAVLIDQSADTGSVTFTANQGDDIVCDWYNLTSGDGPEPTPTPGDGTTGGTTTLPNTGSGVGHASPTWIWLVMLGLVGSLAAGAGRRMRWSE